MLQATFTNVKVDTSQRQFEDNDPYLSVSLKWDQDGRGQEIRANADIALKDKLPEFAKVKKLELSMSGYVGKKGQGLRILDVVTNGSAAK